MKPLFRLAFAAALLAAAPAVAQPAPDVAFQATTLDLSASGEARAVPDMATITLGVTSDAATASEALHANSAAMAAAVAALRSGGIEARDIQTSNLNLSPRYVYKQNEPPTLTGYQAANQVTITVRDLPRLGQVLDAAVGAGATNIASISFGLLSPEATRNTARLAAVKALEDKAALYAEATGYHIRRLVSLGEGGGYTPSPAGYRSMAVAGAAPSVPVSPGELVMRIEVRGVFELTH